MTPKRLAAIGSLLAGSATVLAALIVVAEDFPAGLAGLACLIAAPAAAWWGLLRRGGQRTAALLVAALLLAGLLALLISFGRIFELLVILAGFAGAVAAARVAFAVRETLPAAEAPRRPVLFINPRSGGGKAEKFSLVAEAKDRGIEAVELKPEDDLATLVKGAIERGADALAMAGGDGSQAIVAAMAAERDLPYACIPAGTRNHFALDLGVDRDDVVGALDALVKGGERRADLAEVNGRVFVNNVSLGVYAEAVERESYRDAKLKTILDTVPDALGPDADRLELRWRAEGKTHSSAAMILVSNNRYRLGSPVGSGTRPAIDDGRLGVVVMREPGDGGSGFLRPPWRELSTPRFQIDADRPVPTGIDGETVTLEPPLRFRIRPGVLRVRIAPQHPGASPSAGAPNGFAATLRELLRIGFRPPLGGRRS
jgi:diacylglycerol kinase family enzyme